MIEIDSSLLVLLIIVPSISWFLIGWMLGQFYERRSWNTLLRSLGRVLRKADDR